MKFWGVRREEGAAPAAIAMVRALGLLRLSLRCGAAYFHRKRTLSDCCARCLGGPPHCSQVSAVATLSSAVTAVAAVPRDVPKSYRVAIGAEDGGIELWRGVLCDGGEYGPATHGSVLSTRAAT